MTSFTRYGGFAVQDRSSAISGDGQVARTVPPPMTASVPPAPAPRYAAGDMPALRRDLADWYGGPQATQFYYNAMLMGE